MVYMMFYININKIILKVTYRHIKIKFNRISLNFVTHCQVVSKLFNNSCINKSIIGVKIKKVSNTLGIDKFI